MDGDKASWIAAICSALPTPGKGWSQTWSARRRATSAMAAARSGTGNANQWFLEFEKNDHKPIDQVMSWIGSSDTTSQIKLKFGTKEEATLYAKKNNLLFFIDEGSEKKMNIRKNGYGDNFDYNRKRPWTH